MYLLARSKGARGPRAPLFRMRRIASVNQSREDFWSEAVCGRARRQPARIGRGLGAAVRERERVERPHRVRGLRGLR